jgi:oxaloacetate decarboxylase alpha subunit
VSPIEFVDTSTRDGNQSLWGATGLTTPDVLGIAPAMDRVGFRALDFTTSTHMAVSVRFHHEDPWERLRRVSAAMPNTPLTFLTTGMRFISWEPAEEDVIRLALRCVIRNGIRRIQVAEPMNDPDALITLARLARQEGAQEVVIGLTYSRSAVHDDEHYVTRARRLAEEPEIDRLYLKDPGGLVSVDRLRELGPRLFDAFGDRPIELHSHCTIGLAPQAYLEGCKLGFAALHTAVGPLGQGTSQPVAESTVRDVEAIGFDHALDVEALAEVSAHFRALAELKGLPPGAPRAYDATYEAHQLPGGVVTTMRRQLEEIRRGELFDAALAEVGRVRAEFGYPIVVTPYAQFLVTQASMNVITPERYATVPDEIIRYFLGHFGQPPAPVDPDVADRILSTPRAKELARSRPLSLDGARERFGASISDEELLLRMTMPAEQVDAMLASPGPPASAARPGRNPLVTLLAEIQHRPSIGSLHFKSGDDEVVWRRAS